MYQGKTYNYQLHTPYFAFTILFRNICMCIYLFSTDILHFVYKQLKIREKGIKDLNLMISTEYHSKLTFSDFFYTTTFNNNKKGYFKLGNCLGFSKQNSNFFVFLSNIKLKNCTTKTIWAITRKRESEKVKILCMSKECRDKSAKMKEILCTYCKHYTHPFPWFPQLAFQ